MKYLVAALIIFFSAISLSYGQSDDVADISPKEETPSTLSNKQPPKKSDRYIFAGLTGGIGFSITLGDLAGSGEQKTDAGLATSFGVIGGYQFMNWAGAALRVDYTEKEIIFNRDNTGQKEISIITTQHVDLSLGYRGFWSYLYWETGFYYGFQVGTWSKDVSLDGSITSSHLVDASTTGASRFQAGWYIETGVRIEVSDNILLLFGLNLEVPFVEAYVNTTDQDKLQPMSGIFNLSVLYRI